MGRNVKKVVIILVGPDHCQNLYSGVFEDEKLISDEIRTKTQSPGADPAFEERVKPFAAHRRCQNLYSGFFQDEKLFSDKIKTLKLMPGAGSAGVQVKSIHRLGEIILCTLF